MTTDNPASEIAEKRERHELPSVKQIQKWRIEGLMKHCRSAVPYINAAHSPSEPDQVFMWREGFTHVFNMLVARDEEIASLTAQLARCREAAVEVSDTACIGGVCSLCNHKVAPLALHDSDCPIPKLIRALTTGERQ